MASHDMSALLTWISSLQTDEDAIALQYEDLIDGTHLYAILQRLYAVPDLNDEEVGSPEAVWAKFINTLQECFKTATGGIVASKFLPDVAKIYTAPDKPAEGREEMEKALRLLLVCAVKAEDNERYVTGITTLDEHVQGSLMHHIQEVIGLQQSQRSEFLQSLSNSLRLSSRAPQLQIPLGTPLSSIGSSGGDFEMFPSLDASYKDLVTELTESKASTRELQQKLNAVTYEVEDLEEELKDAKEELDKLKKENLQLQVEARNVRTLRDENDILREQLDQLERSSSLTHGKPSNDARQEVTALRTRLKEATTELGALRHERDALVEENKRNHFEHHRLVQLERELERTKQSYTNLAQENDKNLSELYQLRGAMERTPGEASIEYGRTGYGLASLQSRNNTENKDFEEEHPEIRMFEEQGLSEATTTSETKFVEDHKQEKQDNFSHAAQASCEHYDKSRLASLKRDLEHLRLSNDSAEKHVLALQREKRQFEHNEKTLRKRLSETAREHAALYKEYVVLKKQFSQLAEEHSHCGAVIASLQKLVTETTTRQTLLQLRLDELLKHGSTGKLPAVTGDRGAEGTSEPIRVSTSKLLKGIDELDFEDSLFDNEEDNRDNKPPLVTKTNDSGAPNEHSASSQGERTSCRSTETETFDTATKSQSRVVKMKPLVTYPPSLDCLVRPPDNREGVMQIFVKTLSGQTLTVEVRGSDTVENFKAKVEERMGIPLGHQRLVLGCKQMQDGHHLSEYGVHPEATVSVLVRLSGGGGGGGGCVGRAIV